MIPVITQINERSLRHWRLDKRSKESSVHFIGKWRAMKPGTHQIDHGRGQGQIKRRLDVHSQDNRKPRKLPSDSLQQTIVEARHETHAHGALALLEHKHRVAALSDDPSLFEQR